MSEAHPHTRGGNIGPLLLMGKCQHYIIRKACRTGVIVLAIFAKQNTPNEEKSVWIGITDAEEKGKMCASNIEKPHSTKNFQTPCVY